MTSKQAHQKLNEELGEYVRLNSDAEKEAFWHRITHEAEHRSETEKVAFQHAIADDIEAIRERVLALKKKVHGVQEPVS